MSAELHKLDEPHYDAWESSHDMLIRAYPATRNGSDGYMMYIDRIQQPGPDAHTRTSFNTEDGRPAPIFLPHQFQAYMERLCGHAIDGGGVLAIDKGGAIYAAVNGRFEEPWPDNVLIPDVDTFTAIDGKTPEQLLGCDLNDMDQVKARLKEIAATSAKAAEETRDEIRKARSLPILERLTPGVKTKDSHYDTYIPGGDPFAERLPPDPTDPGWMHDPDWPGWEREPEPEVGPGQPSDRDPTQSASPKDVPPVVRSLGSLPEGEWCAHQESSRHDITISKWQDDIVIDKIDRPVVGGFKSLESASTDRYKVQGDLSQAVPFVGGHGGTLNGESIVFFHSTGKGSISMPLDAEGHEDCSTGTWTSKFGDRFNMQVLMDAYGRSVAVETAKLGMLANTKRDMAKNGPRRLADPGVLPDDSPDRDASDDIDY